MQLCFNVCTHEYHIIDTAQEIKINLLDVKSVYFRRPEINTDFTNVTIAEANFLRGELLFTLEGLYKILRNAFWLNTIESIRNAENKVYQLMLATEIGFKIPNTILTNNPPAGFNFYQSHNERCIIKPIKSGLVAENKEEGVIFTSVVHLNEENINRIVSCPVYLQQHIEKMADVRVTIVGTTIYSALIHSQERKESIVDWRKTIIPLRHSEIDLPIVIVEKCLELTKRLDLNFGAIDMILDKNGQFVFLEINPNGQWAWIQKQLDYPILQSITDMLIEKAA